MKAVELPEPSNTGVAVYQWQTGTDTLVYVTIKFNTLVIWKDTLSGYCDDPPGPIDWQCHQDARKTSNHEMGHAQGLEHVPSSQSAPAVMKGGFRNYYHVQDDDEDGIVAIYGPYAP